MTIRAAWADGLVLTFPWKRRWFPWGADNVVLFGTLWSRHYDLLHQVWWGTITGFSTSKGRIGLPEVHKLLRHEATHVRQRHEHGELGMWCLRDREAAARAAEPGPWPTLTEVLAP